MTTCPTCGESNVPGARFCQRCGTFLERVAAAPGEERKVVTVLFCDLVGFTARSDRADPEDVKATLRPFHALLKREIEHFGGTVDKFIGDEAMGVFGAPVVHEDDPIRAVMSALRITEGIAELNAAHPGLDLAFRVGVETGEAVVAYGSGPQIGESVTGDVVNVAGRLQAVAPINGIVVGQATFEATRDIFVYDALDPVPVKGKAEPVAIWRPTAFRGRMGVGVELREHPPTPFIGRTDELALLRGTFRRTVRESSVQLVTVVGEPGVGKSRLISELARFIDELPEVVVRYRQGRCLPYGEGITFWALSEVVKAEAGILESDEPEEAAAKLAHAVEAFVEDPSERDWVRARLGPLVGLGDPAAGTVARQESFTAWRRFFEAVAAERPLVLVMEDLHWADDPLLEFLDHLIDWSTRVPMLVVCATRPELFEHHPEWGGGKRNSTTVSLPPLSSRQTAMLVSALLDQAVLPAEAQTMLLERSGGNPLYAEEFVRMLTDRGILDPRGGLRLDPSGEVPVPQTVQALIAARLDTLSPEQKGLLHDAAVVGRVFWAGALAAMSGRDESEVRDLLHESVRKELVRPSRVSSFRGQVEYSFWHVLIRDVAYGQIPRAARGAKHRAAAEWIEAASSDRVADQAELLAHHYGQALELARVLGLVAEEDELVDVTGRALVMAGDRAARLDTAKAARYYERALDLLPEGHRARPGVLLALARSMTASGRFAEATELYRRSIAGYREAGDRRGLGLALAMSGRAMYNQADPSGADSSLTEAVAILEAEPPGPELAGAYGRAAGQALVQSRYRECLDWAEKALALAEELGLEDEAVRARQFRGAARAELGLPGGLEDLWTALRQGLELGLGEETSVAYGNLAYQLWLEDGPAIGEQVWSASVEFSDVRGFAAQGMWSRVGLMEVLYDLGRWDRLLELAAEVEGWDRVHELALLAPLARVHRARVLLRQDRVGEAAVLVPTFLDELRATSRTEFVAPALVIAAAIEDAQGHRETALSLIEAFREDTAEHLNFRAEWLPDALRIVLREDVPGDVPGTVLGMVRALVPDEELSSSRYRIALATGRAILLAAEGSLEEAAAAQAKVATEWATYGHVVEEALARLALGRALVELGREDEAEAHVAAAREVLLGLGARSLAGEADDVLTEPAAQTS